MGQRRYARCKACRRHRDEVGELSHQRLCEECGRRRFDANQHDLTNHSGAGLLEWRRGVAASVGAVLLDDLEALLP